MPPSIINLSSSTPAAPAGSANVRWQADSESPRNVSANLPAFTGDSGSGGAMGLVPAPAAGDAAAGKVLKADGTWYTPMTLETNGVANGSQSLLNLVAGSGVALNDDGNGDVTLSLGEEYNPIQFVFGAPTSINAANLQPSSFVTMTEPFTSDSGQFTRYTEGTEGAFSVSGGQATITHSGAENDIITETSSSFSAPQAFVQIYVNSGGTDTTSYDNAGVGLFKDASNFVCASWDRIGNAARIQVKIAGTTTFLASVAHSYAAPYRVGFSLVANSACFYIDTGSGWSYLTGADITSHIDFRTVANLSGWKAGFTVANGGAGSIWVFSQFQAGYFGTVATRDNTLVTLADGSAYLNNGSTTFTATCVDGLGTGYMGLFSFNLATNALSQTGIILTSRNGQVLTDLAGQVIYDPSSKGCKLLLASWANDPFTGGTLQVLYGTSASSLLSGFNVVPVTQWTLPGATASGYGAYDPMMAYDGANSRWLLAYTITSNTRFTGNPFYAAAAYSTDLSAWTAIGADTANTGWEGTKIIRANNAYWIAAGGPAGMGNSSRVYNSSLAYVGALQATFNGGNKTQPHPMVFGVGEMEYLVTFDDTSYDANSFTWGRWIVETAARFSGAVGSLNGLTGAVSLAAGSGVTITPSGNTLTLAASGSLTNPMTTQGDIIVGGASGAPARLAAGVSGYVLTSGGAGVEPSWAAGGGGGGATSYYSPLDVPPLTPNAMDDEFTGGTLASKWTTVYTGTPALTFYGGSYLQAVQAAQAPDAVSSIFQTAPTAPYTVVLKLLLPAFNEDYHYAGMAVRDSATGKWIKLSVATANWGVATQYWSAQNTYSSTEGTISPNYNAPVWMYLKVADDGTNLSFSYSMFGNTWIVLFSGSRTAFLANPDQVGIHWGVNATSSDTAAVFDFFRRTA